MTRKKFVSWNIRRSKNYHKLEWVNSGELLEDFIKFINPAPEETIIDLGTGTGKVAEAVYRKGAKVGGVDYSMEMLIQASKQINLPIMWIQGDANFLPFPDGSINKVSARMILHHLINPLKAVLECLRILKTGGKLFICEGIAPNDDSFNNWVKINQILEPGRKAFSPEILERLLIDAGFTSIEKKIIVTPKLSTKDWLKNRGDNPKIREQVMEMRRNLPENEKKSWNLKNTGNDILVDVPWLLISGCRPQK
ncbi:class I SAM-dependent methyltransferase [Candidatus Gottesmanbacteria bacterium]|nr:class I SAM-dependent methyltransferase [Candidatus Gottesmanbacteria bacterium]